MKPETLIHTGRILMRCYARVLLNLDILYSAPHPTGAKIFAANHPTTTDPFLLSVLSREPIRIMVNASVFEVPLFRSYLTRAGHIPVGRGQGQGDSIIAQAVTNLQSGNNIGIFPEGALSPESGNGFGVLPAHSGVARIALLTQKPVIPIGIALEKQGVRTKHFQFSNEPATSRWMVRGAYVVTVGSPLYLTGNPDDRLQVKDAAAQVTEEIRRLASLSEERLNQRRVVWKSLLPRQKLFTLSG